MKYIRRKDVRDFLNISGNSGVSDINSNGIGNINKYNGIQDPVFLTFSIWLDMESDINIGGTSSFSNLLLPKTDVNSAINYLIRINRRKESGYLEEFREQLLYIQKNKPWYFQSISGLNELMFLPSGENPSRREKDKKLTIETLESFDMQMHFLADLYNKSVYDMVNKKYLLPKNMQQFNCKVIVTEIRDLFEVVETLNSDVDDKIGILDNEKDQSYKSYLTDLRNDKGSWLNKIESDKLDLTSNVYEDSDNDNVALSSKFNEMDKARETVNSRKRNKTKLQTLQEKLTYKIFELYYCKFDFNKFPSFENLSVAAMPEQSKMGFDIIPGLNFTTTQYGFLEWVVSEYNKNFKTSNSKYITNNGFDEYKYVGWHNYTHNDVPSISNRNANLDELEEEIRYNLDSESETTDSGQVTIDQMTNSSKTSKSKESSLYGNLLKQSKSSAAKYLSEVESKYNDEKMSLFNKIHSSLDDIDITNPHSISEAIENMKDIIDFSDSYVEPKMDEIVRKKPEAKDGTNIEQNILDTIRQNRPNNSFDEIGKFSPTIIRDDADNEFNDREVNKLYKLDEFGRSKPQINDNIDEFSRDVIDINKNVDEITHEASDINDNIDDFKLVISSEKKAVDDFKRVEVKSNDNVDEFERTKPSVSDNINDFKREEPKQNKNIDSFKLKKPEVNEEFDDVELDVVIANNKIDSFERNEPNVNDNIEEIDLTETVVNDNIDSFEHLVGSINDNIDDISLTIPYVNTGLDGIDKIVPMVNNNFSEVIKSTATVRNNFDSIINDELDTNDSIDNISNTQLDVNNNIDTLSRTSIYENKTIETLNRITITPNNNFDDLDRVSANK